MLQPSKFKRHSACFSASTCGTSLVAECRATTTTDRSSLSGTCREDVAVLRDYIAAFARHPSQLLYKGKVLVSTFAGQDSLFGLDTLHEAWQFVKDTLEEIAPVSPMSEDRSIRPR